MPFVKRDAGGHITDLVREPPREAERRDEAVEEVAADDPQLLDFLLQF